MDDRGPRLDERHLRRAHLRAQEGRQPDARRRGPARRAAPQARELRAARARITSARASTSRGATASPACSSATTSLKALDEEAAFSEWVEQPLSIARYEIRGPNRLVSDRPTILEMLAFRRAAQRVVELTDMLLLSLIAVTGGRTGPLRFAVCMTGPAPAGGAQPRRAGRRAGAGHAPRRARSRRVDRSIRARHERARADRPDLTLRPGEA